MNKTMHETHTGLSSGVLIWYVCKRVGEIADLTAFGLSDWVGSLKWAGALLGRPARAGLQDWLMGWDPCLGKKQRPKPCKVNSLRARVRNTIQVLFCVCVCVCVCLKLGSLLLNMEKALQCDPEFLSPGNLSGQPLTFNGVHDVALLEVSQFRFLHHHCKTKHFSEASWAASRCLHLTSLKFNIVSLPAPILAT